MAEGKSKGNHSEFEITENSKNPVWIGGVRLYKTSKENCILKLE